VTSNHDTHLTSYHRTLINIIFDVVKQGKGGGVRNMLAIKITNISSNMFGEIISRRKSL